MSLSSFLLGSAKGKSSSSVDGDLDALFRSSAAHLSAPLPTEKKRKRPEPDTSIPDSKRSKTSKAKKAEPTPSTSAHTDHDRKSTGETSKKDRLERVKKGGKVNRKTAQRKELAEDSSEEDNAGLEDAYHLKSGKKAPQSVHADNKESTSDSDSEDGGGVSQLVHETVSKQGKANKIRTKQVKFVPADETSEQRNARTIFVGNVPVDVAKNKSSLKSFKRHILTHVPSAKIESTRFRSVAFQNPTSKLTAGDASAQPSQPKPDEGRQHDRARAASWRAANPPDDAEEREKERKRLTTQEKKRIAFIKHEIHDESDAMHAYVVFAHPAPRAANVPALPVLDPYEAVRLAVEKVDGTVFMERTLRVDVVGKARVAGKEGAMLGDPKKTVFVGNLDFASKEEDLRVFFEGVVSAERGPRGTDEGSDEDQDQDEEAADPASDEPKPKTWVARVRIIRDKDTQLGKGFAYVQFSDRECVDEVVALEEGKLKFAKRKLRVQRCKTLPGGGKLSHAKSHTPSGKTTSSGKPARPPRPAPGPKPGPIPKGDPRLGEKLAHLPKEKRKEVKAADSDRVARRLAKKKARNALEKAGVKEQKKDRERVRKTAFERKGGAAQEQKKGRIRSEKSLTKRNTKKNLH
ncbi:hypothetical protein BV25DRAFT_1057022 [Artomyces pyxidatus]|uniref:Uncharacterized protein n=1 Tax=Artomyces pyxidatus TaxID=48021 RepID=A0ACB8SU10_9AGAM|nr:hypothetical protein BV25DRAFT_1057022 [Artomyces pyxidatus]